ncbi:hypothetical protein WG78_15725 [Amantichitinum ursilacus]|uniref:Uncharacterized protein n=1 Tax=Amantichitinum ursilacus TaxID=857265 RepID=A0A0N0GMF2_9NEIS|nr:hypothetical protein WG78_15725 [Amantichitinum ursilacus]
MVRLLLGLWLMRVCGRMTLRTRPCRAARVALLPPSMALISPLLITEPATVPSPVSVPALSMVTVPVLSSRPADVVPTCKVPALMRVLPL